MTERIKGFDALKGIACIAVVFMHCEFPGTAGTIIQCLTRWGVPLFFAVSGFFYNGTGAKYALNKAKHIFYITLWATLFYILYEIVLHLAAGDLMAYISAEITLTNTAAWLVFNSPMFINGHLWFLFALLYVYLFQAVIEHFKLTRFAPQMCVVLLLGHFVLSYGFYLAGHPLQAGFYRNFLLEGIPFFYIGLLLRQYGMPHIQRWNHVKEKAIILLVVGAALSVAERYLIGRDFSVHIASILVLLTLLVLAADRDIDRAPKALCKLGKNESDMVYILHPAVYLTLDQIIPVATAGIVYLWARPILTLFITIGVAIIVNGAKNRLLVKNNGNRQSNR